MALVPWWRFRLEAWRSDTQTVHSVSDLMLPVSLGCFLAVLLGRDTGDSEPNRTHNQTALNDDSPWPPSTRPTPSHVTNGQNSKTAPREALRAEAPGVAVSAEMEHLEK